MSKSTFIFDGHGGLFRECVESRVLIARSHAAPPLFQNTNISIALLWPALRRSHISLHHIILRHIYLNSKRIS
jgi:hypothetical protein